MDISPVTAASTPSIDLWPSIGLVIIGLAALLFGGHLLVTGAAGIAKSLGVSGLLIGLTVVAFGTSAPELALNVTAAASSPAGVELAFGNVIGSNMANIGLVLGLACLMGPIIIRGQVLRQDLPLLIGAELTLILMAWLTPGIDRFGGIILLVGMIGVSVLWYRNARDHADDALTVEAETLATQEPMLKWWVAISLVVSGLVLLLSGAKAAEVGAVAVAQYAGVGEVVIGLTIVAIATSLPEVATAVMAVRKNESDLAVGAVVGSNLFNILLVLACTALVRPIPLPEGHSDWTMIIMLALTLALYLGPIRLETSPSGRSEEVQSQLGRAWGGSVLTIWAMVMVWTVLRT